MRGSSLAALAACLLIITGIGAADAQRQRQATTRQPELTPSMRAQPVEAAVRFRATSAASRAAAARRLGLTSSGPEQMGDTFVVTPRVPFVEGRATMRTSHMSLDANYDTTGVLQGFTALGSDVSFRVTNAGNHRFLVECSVSSSSPLIFRMISVDGTGDEAGFADVAPSNGRISFVTHYIWNTGLIGISPTASQQTVHAWYVTGCEFTVLPT